MRIRLWLMHVPCDLWNDSSTLTPSTCTAPHLQRPFPYASGQAWMFLRKHNHHRWTSKQFVRNMKVCLRGKRGWSDAHIQLHELDITPYPLSLNIHLFPMKSISVTFTSWLKHCHVCLVDDLDWTHMRCNGHFKAWMLCLSRCISSEFSPTMQRMNTVQNTTQRQ